MKVHSSEAVKYLLYEYGSAFRGDWASIDGRSVEYQLSTLARLVDNGPVDMREARNNLNLCLMGEGHWQDWCGEDCDEQDS